ncbi:hypothetical protein H4582DRAFT_2160258 [Lactarius indigo]|nr:hypothetical protein H4582DRAFT_2160258 [Lactarius indigo]
MSDDSHSMPLNYASYLVDLLRHKETVETLERGRTLLWSEMHRLRTSLSVTSVDQLLETDQHLGNEFAAVNRDLEELTSPSPSRRATKISMSNGAANSLRIVDPFSRLLLKQRRLLKERDELISQIQVLPSFDCFLKPPSFDTHRSAASSGPVIIVNHVYLPHPNPS